MKHDLRDTVVLVRDAPEHGLRAGDLGAVVGTYPPDALEVESVTASGRTTALVRLRTADVRAIADTDLVAPCERSRARRDSSARRMISMQLPALRGAADATRQATLMGVREDFSVSLTPIPRRASMSMSVSTLKRSIRPLRRSLTLGWVTPKSFAACPCVSPRLAIAFSSATMRSARTRRCPASSVENPTSLKTLPLDGVFRSFMAHLAPSLPALDHQLPQALAGNLDVASRGFLGPLLEPVQNVHPFSELREVQHSVLETGVNSDLPNARAHRRHELPVGGFDAELNPPQLVAREPSRLPGEAPDICARAAQPGQRFHDRRRVYKYLDWLSTGNKRESPHNSVNLPTRPVTVRACARPAPGWLAGCADRETSARDEEDLR